MNDNDGLKSIGANDLLRFILEIWALIAFGYWGVNQNIVLLNYVLMIVLPTAVAVVWGVFAVPNDPSRSGKAPVPIPGAVRLLLEIMIFGVAFLIMLVSDLFYASWIFIALVIIHYILAHERIKWLFRN